MNKAEQKKALMMAEIKAKREAVLGAEAYRVHTEILSLGVVVFVREIVPGGAVVVAGFAGRRTKPDLHYRYGGMSYAERAISAWVDGLQYKAKEKAKSTEGHALKVGDVLSSCWGYDQTRYDYYQVTKLIGKCTVEICEISRQIDASGGMQGESVPRINSFVGKPMTCRVNVHGSVKVGPGEVYASKKEYLTIAGVQFFTPDCFTSYA